MSRNLCGFFVCVIRLSTTKRDVFVFSTVAFCANLAKRLGVFFKVHSFYNLYYYYGLSKYNNKYLIIGKS